MTCKAREWGITQKHPIGNMSLIKIRKVKYFFKLFCLIEKGGRRMALPK